MSSLHYLRAMQGIVGRELWRFVRQRERFVSALVRPLVWLFIFAAGFRATLGVAISPLMKPIFFTRCILPRV